MVRLKYLRGSKASLPRQFQFHYGSIKIYKEAGLNPALLAFQFHYGSIKMRRRFLRRRFF